VDALIQMESLIRQSPGGDTTFFDNADFPWTGAVESHWPLMSAELGHLMRAIDFLPGFEEIQVKQGELSSDKRWKIFPLFAYGQWFNTQRCPTAIRALQCIPNLKSGMFSVLQAGKELPAHRGVYAGVLRYHLGMKVPQPELCGIRVGDDSATWHEGASLIFDDSHEHTAWNRSDEDRIVLFVDFSRPLPPDLHAMNEAIIYEVSATDFVTRAVNEWIEWDKKHGRTIDSHMGIAP